MTKEERRKQREREREFGLLVDMLTPESKVKVGMFIDYILWCNTFGIEPDMGEFDRLLNASPNPEWAGN